VQRGGPAGGPFVRAAAAYKLSAALAVLAAVAGALSFFAAGLLRGPAVMNGSTRGTALVVMAVAVPLLVWSMVLAARGSARAIVGWLGALGYLLYNALLFVFATPFNRLFLLYLAMLSLSVWSVVAVSRHIDVVALGARFSDRLPARAIAAYAWAIVALNALAWLRQIVPGLAGSGTPAFLAGTGLPTSPVYVQDLAFWLPLMAAAAVWMWRREAWGYLVVGSVLVMWVIESLGIATDQWFGHRADPASTVASGAAVPIFAAVAVVGLVPLYFYFRSLPSVRSPRSGGPHPVASGEAVWPDGRRGVGGGGGLAG
jgi:hypothetical protein